MAGHVRSESQRGTNPVREDSDQSLGDLFRHFDLSHPSLSRWTGEDADLSCGDPWYRDVQPGEPGSSLVAVRTDLGRRLLKAAMNAGYVTLEPAEAWKMVRSQENLIAKRGAIGGRIAVMRLLGLPAPRLKGFSLFQNWMKLSFPAKLRSTGSTLRRVVTRGYFRRTSIVGKKSDP